ncbi:MAG: hypothetical protein JW832_08830 [Deltaproteobacteria bacterium]|nr:hypothetical protein [Deltaproteobacteria bacterium]
MAHDPPLLKQIIAALCAVPDTAMRSHILAEKLQALPAHQAAELLQRIIIGASRRKGPYCLALDALSVPFLTQRMGNPFMSDVYTAASEQGFEELISLLSRPEASRTADQEAGPQEDLPAGVRMSRAKTLNRSELARMFADTDPRVIRVLLQNPALTESDVLKLCSRRPARADVQREVFICKKWFARYSVKKSLVFNPYTPTDIGLKIIHFLMVQDVLLVAKSLDLHPALREIARQILQAQNFPVCDAGDELPPGAE